MNDHATDDTCSNDNVIGCASSRELAGYRRPPALRLLGYVRTLADYPSQLVKDAS